MCDRYLNRNNPGNKGDDNTSQQKRLCLNDNWVILWQEAQGLNPLTSCPSLTPEEGREERWHTTLSTRLHGVERLVKPGEITQSIHRQSHTHTHTHTHTSTVHICMWIIHLLCEDLFLFLEKKNRQCTILLDSIKQEGQAGLLSHASINEGHLSKNARWIEPRITQRFSEFKNRIPKSACKTSKLNQ